MGFHVRLQPRINRVAHEGGARGAERLRRLPDGVAHSTRRRHSYVRRKLSAAVVEGGSVHHAGRLTWVEQFENRRLRCLPFSRGLRRNYI